MPKNRQWVIAAEIQSMALIVVMAFFSQATEVLSGEGGIPLSLLLGRFILEKGVLFQPPSFMTRYAGITIPAVPVLLLVILAAFAYPGDYDTILGIMLPVPAMLAGWLAGAGLKRLLWRLELGPDTYRSNFPAVARQSNRLTTCVFATIVLGIAIFAITTVVFGRETLLDNKPSLVLLAIFSVLLISCTGSNGGCVATFPQSTEDSRAETLTSQTHMSHDSV